MCKHIKATFLLVPLTSSLPFCTNLTSADLCQQTVTFLYAVYGALFACKKQCVVHYLPTVVMAVTFETDDICSVLSHTFFHLRDRFCTAILSQLMICLVMKSGGYTAITMSICLTVNHLSICLGFVQKISSETLKLL